MQINKTVHVTLTEDELKAIVAEYVGKKVNKDIRPENVSFTIGKKFDSDYDDRFGTDYIKVCSVNYLDS